MDPNHLRRFLDSTPSQWNSWTTSNDTIIVDLSGAELRGHDFRGRVLWRANLQNADLQDADFTGVNLGNANLTNANLRSAKLKQANLNGANLSEAIAEQADFTLAQAVGVLFFKAKCMDACFVSCDLRESRFFHADFQRADFNLANLERGEFGNTDLRCACFQTCNITSTKFKECDFGSNNLDHIVHDASQTPLQDFTETIKYVHPLHWGKIRTIGKLPLFSASYTTLGFGVTYANCVAALNRTKVLTILRYPIEVPSRISWIMVASLLLAVGATLYAVFCPKRVQEFSEVQWTEGMNRSRLQYLAEAWRSPWVMYATFAFTIAGGLIAIWLFLELLASALWFVFTPTVKQ